MGYQFELIDEKEQPVLSMRTRTPVGNLPQELGKAYGAIIQYIGEIGEKTEGPAFAAYYSMDMEDLDVEMGFLVPKPIPGNDEIQANVIPAGKQAVYLYKGPYAEMEPAYRAMMAWLDENSYVPTGVSYEFYYNSPEEVPESELLTKIIFPLK
ncbi:MAG TPA: GyrI-like domain-containing protein [Anaerovoracaceae bacterium]|nr:GyrI-like domain-containing protein [Anaerovoracaceae bacterium]